MKQVVNPATAEFPTLPLNYNEVKDFCIDGLRYDTLECYKQEYKNIFLFSTGIIYTPISILPESAITVHESFLKWHPKKYTPFNIIKDVRMKRIRLLPVTEKYLSIFDEWSSNHFHLHADILPRLLFFNKIELAKLTLILPDTAYLRESALSILRFFNFEFKNILFMKQGEIYFVRQCMFVSKVAVPGFFVPDLMRKLKKRILLPKVTSDFKRIYVQRKNVPNRKVLNEIQVVKVLKEEFNFEVIDFGQHTFEEQVLIAGKAELMVGMHGAGLTNLMYLPEGAGVVEFRRDGIHHNHCYWHLASSVDINYTIVFGKPDDDTKVLEGPGCNLFIDLDTLRRGVDLAIKNIKRTI